MTVDDILNADFMNEASDSEGEGGDSDEEVCYIALAR